MITQRLWTNSGRSVGLTTVLMTSLVTKCLTFRTPGSVPFWVPHMFKFFRPVLCKLAMISPTDHLDYYWVHSRFCFFISNIETSFELTTSNPWQTLVRSLLKSHIYFRKINYSCIRGASSCKSCNMWDNRHRHAERNVAM